MTWSASVGDVLHQAPAFVESEVLLVDSATGARVTLPFRYDGSQRDLERAVRSFTLAADPTTQKRTFVARGTVLDLTAPRPDPLTPAQQARIAWQDARHQVVKCRDAMRDQIPGFDQRRLDKAIVDANALYDVSFEDLV